jgi:hypothetical protein
MCFYPAWPPDGQYIAAYCVNRKTGHTGTSWWEYNVLEELMGPWITAETVFTTKYTEEGPELWYVSLDQPVAKIMDGSWHAPALEAFYDGWNAAIVYRGN